ncbi:MAG: PilZ domain-containing protein [Sulfurospirillaceae bacterium]|nr:PilZ domain-containing protein [Sulfurospirillaceae bacterium]MDD2825428.1 PilZ domain-containing protein [Sulfurospirillaceae bacterium]
MQNEILTSEQNSFFTTVTLFLEEFEPKFLNYFISLCSSYHCALPYDEKEEIARSLYRNVLKCSFEAMNFEDNIFIKMRQDGVMVGFLINRSMFYLLENYIIFAKNHQIAPQIEILIGCMTQFIQVLENAMTDKVNLPIGELDSAFNNSLIMNNNTIIDSLKKMQRDNQSVRFLNLYQGVPISYDATILEVDAQSITFSIDRLQEVAMKLDGNAYIVKNKYLSKPLKADILYNNFSENTVTLNNFIYLLNMPAIQREYVRVHPNIIANVYLHQFGNVQTAGRLYDISMKGLGVVSHENNGIFIGAKVLVDFDLNSILHHKGDTIKVEAEVINIIEYKDSYRYCMQIFPEKRMIEKITEYILDREKEILENLQDELKEYIF